MLPSGLALHNSVMVSREKHIVFSFTFAYNTSDTSCFFPIPNNFTPPAKCPMIQFNSDTNYPDPIDKGFIPQDYPSLNM